MARQATANPKLTRRNFVVGAATATATVGLASCSPAAQSGGESAASSAEEASAAASSMPASAASSAEVEPSVAPAQVSAEDPYADCTFVYAPCTPECQHHCLKGYVRDGKLVKVEAGEVNESKPCARGLSRVELCNSEKRLTKPLRLKGEKGSGDFEEISWEEAYDLIEEKLKAALETGGNEAIAFATGSGNFSALSREIAPPFFSWLGGGVAINGNTCCAGVDAGMTPILGKRAQPPRNEIEKSDYIIAWGNNPAVTMGGYFERFENMTKNGGTLVTIDPFQSETADKSQEWLRPWPGSDSALALAMLKVVIDEGLVDEEYLLAHTTAPCLIDRKTNAPYFEDAEDDTSYMAYDSAKKEIVRHDTEGAQLALSVEGTDAAADYVTIYDLIVEEANKWNEETLEAETGVAWEDAARIARDYANAEHAMIIQNMGGFERTENGAYQVATQVYLALFTGNVGHEGDGLYDIGGVKSIHGVNPPFESNPDAAEIKGIPRVHFGEGVLERAEGDNPIQFMMIITTDCAAQWPNANMVKKGLDAIPFVVTIDQVHTSTTLHSDLVLPCTAVFESENVCAESRSAVLTLSEAGVTPPGEAKPDVEIFNEIATRFGFGDKIPNDPPALIGKVIEPLGITYEELKEKKAINTWDMVPDWIAYKDAKFYTSTEKAHLWVQKWVDEGYPGIACHMRPEESPLNTDGLAANWPLAAVQIKVRHGVHTTFHNLESMLCMDGHEPEIVINPEDAEERGIKHGDTVVAVNDRGEHEGKAYVTTRMKKGVVGLQNGWNDVTAKSSSSAVTNNKFPTLGTIHCCNSTLVDVRKVG